ncbi:hypothetical protein C8P68_102211 [Mucilaginibacter yixingensis]|uniref:Uncharacterized protein n=1 Tax=Mucilaginibacter yixingensis TaxID=1295612 RepID=A0A2T5JCA0_9SPHI|nr:hypothetical protein C8P68_102211 [Mucilaginibacter yixingensis]
MNVSTLAQTTVNQLNIYLFFIFGDPSVANPTFAA